MYMYSTIYEVTQLTRQLRTKLRVADALISTTCIPVSIVVGYGEARLMRCEDIYELSHGRWVVQVVVLWDSMSIRLGFYQLVRHICLYARQRTTTGLQVGSISHSHRRIGTPPWDRATLTMQHAAPLRDTQLCPATTSWRTPAVWWCAACTYTSRRFHGDTSISASTSWVGHTYYQGGGQHTRILLVRLAKMA